MITLKRIYFLTLVAFLSMATSCKKQSDDVTPFDKESLLINFSDNLIAPSLAMLETNVGQMHTDFVAFEANPTQVNLDVLRNSWKNACLTWQSVKTFDIGPIRTNGFKGATGVYPTDAVKIEANISSGSYNLASAGNTDAIGLYALDFLLFRTDALSFLVGNTNCMTYTGDLIEKLKTETTTVKNAWTAYAPSFKSSTGTETTSGFSQLVNEFNRDYELAKTAKLGIPIGNTTLGVQLPEYLEARNSEISFDLIEQSIGALKKCYTGNSFVTGAPGVGFDDYLEHLERSDLNEMIIERFDAILVKIDSFSGTLEDEMGSNPQALSDLYTLMQGLVVYLKTDMTSAFGVLITYQDNDGD